MRVAASTSARMSADAAGRGRCSAPRFPVPQQHGELRLDMPGSEPVVLQQRRRSARLAKDRETTGSGMEDDRLKKAVVNVFGASMLGQVPALLRPVPAMPHRFDAGGVQQRRVARGVELDECVEQHRGRQDPHVRVEDRLDGRGERVRRKLRGGTD